MTLTCQACGSDNSESAAYCGACGTPLAAPRATAERKVVSVLFVDLVGFTAMAERLDPEDVRGILGPYYETVRSELVRYDGTVEKFIGDAVVAIFGAPVAHEDDPERAVRAGHAVCRAVQRLRESGSFPELHVRVGITTGEAIVARGARPQVGEAMAHGDVVNTAARLQNHAPVDGILVDRRTYQATRGQIAFRSASPVEARGKSRPVEAWEAVAPRARLGVDRLRLRRPLVGRNKELETLSAALEEAAGRRCPRLAVVAGPPGIGKSRLVAELLQRVDGSPELFFWRQGRSLPYGEGVTFWALAEIVKAQAGILASDSGATVRDKLRIAVEDAVSSPGDARWVADRLAPLAGVEGTRELRGDSRAEAFAAWRRFLEGIAAKRPLVLVLEDLHWADEGLLDFVSDQLLRRFKGPLLVVATCRPELLERHPDWPGRPGRTRLIELSPLSDGETESVVANLLGRSRAPAELIALLVKRAAGNPLYAEEYVRMLIDRGHLEEAGGAWRLTDAALPLPDSVQAIIAARLDTLPADQKRLLQDAAVLGKGFWHGALTAVGGYERARSEELLRELERKQLVRREQESIVRDEAQFAFSHILVRDVAYGQIPRSDRAEKHRHAAEWIEALSPERSEDRAEMLAHHYATALGFARVVRQETDSLKTRTRFALRNVGDRAVSLNSFGKAARYYASALELWPADGPERADLLFRLGEAQLHAETAGREALAEAREAFLSEGRTEAAAEATVLLGELLWMHADSDSLAYLEDAAALLADSPPSPAKAHVMASLARFLMIHGEHASAIRLGLDSLAMADGLRTSELRAHVLATIGLARTRSGDPDGLADLEESVELAAELNSIESVRGYANLGNALVEAGELERAFAQYERGRAAARGFGDVDRIRWFDAERIYEQYWRGSWDTALELASRVIADAAAGVPTSIEQDARLVRGRIRAARADPAGALEDSERSLELGRRAGYPEMLVPALALQARLHTSAGSSAEAKSLVADALDLWPRRIASSYWLADLALAAYEAGETDRMLAALRPVEGTSRWADAALALVSGDFAAAADQFAKIGTVPDEALARLCSAQVAGREGELAAALTLVRSLGATAFLRRGKAFLTR
jgi:class 3 adenylate cyclase/tetratricopeptide (TPR) repeat protein